MATTKIWAIKDSLQRLIRYAGNPEKTEYVDVKNALHYAADDEKTALDGDEKCYLVSTLHCRGDALESMLKVHKHFGAKGENVAYHAYQSFKPGEVTPEQCHKIGVELAEKLWGSHYQVMIATHLNREHLHNHFIILATSFRNGKKLDIGGNYWKRVLAPASDEICGKYGLSVIQNRGAHTPRQLYFAEKRGEPTPYNLMRKALMTALNLATSEHDLICYLRDMGYDIDLRGERMKSRFCDKWVKLTTLDKELNPGYCAFDFGAYYESNQSECEAGTFIHGASYSKEMEHRRMQNGVYRSPGSFLKPGCLDTDFVKLNTLGRILVVFLSVLGWLPEQAKDRPRFEPLLPEYKAYLRDERKKCEMYSNTARIMAREKLTTAEEVLNYMDKLERDISYHCRNRRALYYASSRAVTPEEKQMYRDELIVVNEAIKKARYEKKCMVNLLERSGVMLDMIEAEMTMRREKRKREYLSEPPKREETRQNSAPIYTNKSKRRSDDYDR